MKKQIGYYTIAAVACGLLEVACVVLLILSILPGKNSFSVEVDEPLSVSVSSLGNDRYVMQISGSIVNQGDKTVVLDQVQIEVGRGKNTYTVELKDVVLAPRMPYEILCDFDDSQVYDRIQSVRGAQNGKIEIIPDNTSGIFTFEALLCLFGAVAFAIALGYFVKQRYYILQETQAEEKQ